MASTSQSSSRAIVAIRALVMLGCLIFIPAVALFRTPLLDLFNSVFGDKPAAASSHTDGARRASPPRWPDAQDQSRELTEASAYLSKPPTLGQPASVQSTAGQPVTRHPQSVAEVHPRGNLSRASQTSQVPIAGPTSSPGNSTEEHLQKQLQRLGATYYFLEYVAQENRYRFFCRVEGNERPFEAWGADSRTTMLAVVGQIAAWRAARYPAGPSRQPRSRSPSPRGEGGRDTAPSTAIRPRSGWAGG